jgi:peptidoglycan/LPS O-acetylase OafA/YrhL
VTEVLRVINQTLLRRVARVTSGREYIAEIDGLRFIAILSVVLFHLNGYVIEKDVGVAASPMAQRVSALFAQGHFGVQLFFVISGFVLLLPFAAAYREGTPRPAIAWYFRRRLTRLEPPYVFNMTVVAILAWVTHKASLAEIAPHFLASVTYTHNAIYHAMSTINSVAWSLEVEVQFYIVAPLIAFVFAIRKRWMRIVLFVGAAAVAVSFQRTDTGDPNALNLLGSIQYFLMGAILADAYLVDWARTPRSTLRWDFVLIGAWAATP